MLPEAKLFIQLLVINDYSKEQSSVLHNHIVLVYAFYFNNTYRLLPTIDIISGDANFSDYKCYVVDSHIHTSQTAPLAQSLIKSQNFSRWVCRSPVSDEAEMYSPQGGSRLVGDPLSLISSRL